MAVKASCTVTLSCYRDTQSVTRYYKLQSSTASTPSKPTTNPPSGWDDTEPTYTSGSTNTLYFCDLTVFSDGTWAYSTVSKSSSYEAAKEAYNKAVAAGDAAQNAQDDIDNLEVGGRNLIVLSSATDGYRISPEGAETSDEAHQITDFFEVEPSTEYTLTTYEVTTNSTTYISMAWFDSDKTFISQPTGAYVATSILKEIYVSPNNASYCRVSYPIELKGKIKMEKGNQSTDWTPAPEDVENGIDNAQSSADQAQSDATDAQNRINDAETIIQQLSDCISMLVTDETGASLMTQTENGWTFSMAEMNQAVSDIANSLDKLVRESSDTRSVVDSLSSAVTDLGELANYVKITTDGSQPCIELGTGNSDFKLLITNTDIRFMEGSSVPAYINNQSLYIRKAVINEELRQGNWVWKVRSNGNLGLVWKGSGS